MILLQFICGSGAGNSGGRLHHFCSESMQNAATLYSDCTNGQRMISQVEIVHMSFDNNQYNYIIRIPYSAMASAVGNQFYRILPSKRPTPIFDVPSDFGGGPT